MTAAASPTTDRVRDAVRDAIEHGLALRVVGSGTWLDANRPVRADLQLATRELAGIIEYVPGDLTITVGAGTTLAEISDATRAARQWLPLDPAGSDAATIGATVATASAGALAATFGTPRDMVLGLECITGRGEVVSAGGRVVKNVAGFDLVRLLTGSWGTLGVITQVTLRLRALPEADVTYAVPILDSPEAMGELLRWVRKLPWAPLALELLDPVLAEAAGIRLGGAVMLVRLGGRATAVKAQEESLKRLGKLHEVAPKKWSVIRGAEPNGAAVVRLSDSLSRFPEVWRGARSVVSRWTGAMLQGSPLRGIARVVLPRGPGGYDALREAFARTNGTRIFERLPARLWPVLSPTRASERLQHGIREAFDPHHLLNPGIFGEHT